MKKEMTEEIRNQRIHIGRSGAATIANLLVGGSYITAFYVALGLSTADVSRINAFACVGMFSASFMVLFTYKRDPSGVRTMKLFSIFYVVIALRLFWASFAEGSAALWILCLTTLIINWTEYMRSSAEITASPHLFGRASYSEFTGRVNSISNVIGLIFSCCLLFVRFNDNVIITLRWFFLASTVFRFGYTFLTQCLRIPKTVKAEELDFTLRIRDMFTKRVLVQSLPHICRGLGGSINALVGVLMLQRISLTATQLTLIVPLSTGLCIVTAYVAGRLSRKVRPGTLLLVGFACSGLFVVASLFGSTPLHYFIIVLGQSVFNNLAGWMVVPGLIFAYDGEELAIMTSVHTIAYGIFMAIGSFIFGPLADRFTLPVMSLGCLLYFACGFLFRKILAKPAHPELYHFVRSGEK